MNKIILKKNNCPKKEGYYFITKASSVEKDSLIELISVYFLNGVWRGFDTENKSFLVYDFPEAFWSDEMVFSGE